LIHAALKRTQGMAITIEKVGRRYYLIGDTYSIKNQIQASGGHFDGDRRAWWTSKQAVAEKFAASTSEAKPQSDAVGETDRVIRGRCLYEGKSYYLLVDGVSSRTGKPYAKLAFRDGSRTFWAQDVSKVQIQKRYQEPTSIVSLRQFAEKAKAREAEHGCGCSCHTSRHCTCNTGFCHLHHDGCDRCGCEN